MARNPDVHTTGLTLEEEYAAQVQAGLHKDAKPVTPVASRESTLNQEIADHLTDVIGRILSAP